MYRFLSFIDMFHLECIQFIYSFLSFLLVVLVEFLVTNRHYITREKNYHIIHVPKEQKMHK